MKNWAESIMWHTLMPMAIFVLVYYFGEMESTHLIIFLIALFMACNENFHRMKK